MTESIRNHLSQLLAETLDLQISSLEFRSIGGGCINETYKVKVNDRISFFLKVNSVSKFPSLFEKEKHGLDLLERQKTISVPSIVHCGQIEDSQFLLLDWIEGGIKTEGFWKLFGEQLAMLHGQTWVNKDGQKLFGLEQDNYIGSLPQFNTPQQNWIDFFYRQRLLPQIRMAKDQYLIQRTLLLAFEKLGSRLHEIFDPEQSALLHGDLWSGNFMCDQKSEPVLIDPAVYFGHRSMDLAMTTLFGGFDEIFYKSYNYHFKFPQNYLEQWEVCNLYPLLVHLNLFGSGYLSQIENILRKWN
jgi:protein-ribulosamine 3-kinase